MITAAPSIEFSEDQEAALRAVQRWRSVEASAGKQTLTLGGYAGCGKTTLVSHLIREWPGVAVAALCGKAAAVLRSKGVESAQTIHSLIYEPVDVGGRITFRKRHHLESWIKTVVIDEASMVSTPIYGDLLSFGLPVLFVGDHGQLEPIGENPRLMVNPEVRLEKIHRQAADNPILRLATAFRENRRVPNWIAPGGELVIGGRDVFWDAVDAVDGTEQFICGFNRTRHEVNARVRAKLGRRDVLWRGDRVICLKNNRPCGIFNGQQFEALDVVECGANLWLRLLTDDGETISVDARKAQFGADLDKDHRGNDVCLFDYAYCVTCHKFQGSESPKAVVLEELARGWEARRWRYTAVTRARDQLIYAR
jgi:exodeoxyribonuclease-5